MADLSKLIEQVAEATPHCGREQVEMSCRIADGQFGWTCRIVRGNNRTLWPQISGYGPTPESAVADVLERVEALRQQEHSASILEEMHAKGDLTDEQLAALKEHLC